MCGRFALQTDLSEIIERFQIQEVACAYQPCDNIYPGQPIAAVIHDRVNQLVAFQWGLIPFWAKNPTGSHKLINARAETVATKPSFKNAFQRHRCLIVADGFYEWQKTGDHKKKPWFIHLRSGAPCGFAGLYEIWISSAGKEIRSCTIITTRANELVSPIHERMPVIISGLAAAGWLDSGVRDRDQLLALLQPYPAEKMACRIRHPTPLPKAAYMFDNNRNTSAESTEE